MLRRQQMEANTLQALQCMDVMPGLHVPVLTVKYPYADDFTGEALGRSYLC
jgi:hypothetical protein